MSLICGWPVCRDQRPGGPYTNLRLAVARARQLHEAPVADGSKVSANAGAGFIKPLPRRLKAAATVFQDPEVVVFAGAGWVGAGVAGTVSVAWP